METGIWQELYRHIRSPRLENAVAGFNMNLDRIITVNRELLDSLHTLPGDFAMLHARLVHSMQYCTAEEWFVADRVQYCNFTRIFSTMGHPAVGGQAGIAALHLSRLGVQRVVCAAPFHGKESSALLKECGVIVPDFTPGIPDDGDKIHLVFEYPPGLVPVAPGVTPRNNRFIVSPVHEPASVLIPGSCMDLFLGEIGTCNRAFLSGYQYLRSDCEFETAASQIVRMKDRNASLRVHIECVSATGEEVTQGFVRHILPVTDSLGLNEQELRYLLDHLGLFSTSPDFLPVLSPVQSMEGALALCQHLGLKRLHVHTFGYYILVIRRDASLAESSRNALLFASREVANAAQGTRARISADGIRAVAQARENFSREYSPGIFSAGTYAILVIPTMIAETISRTAGLGDILSSTAFVADSF
nr:ADP-dependent glucokinase/phosphofructokinase [uncultured Methanoregula sp.]